MRATDGRTRIKICGIRDVETAAVAVEAGADLLGLVLAAGSPRRIDGATARTIAASLPGHVTPVLLVQDPDPRDPALRGWTHEWIQFHGGEDEAFITAMNRRTIRGFRFSIEAVRRWDRCPAVDRLLVDGGPGGTGAAFEHRDLAAMMTELTKPVLLAGGLTPENVAPALETVRPWGVDVSSGVESSRGVKDPERIRAFCAAVRAADAELAA